MISKKGKSENIEEIETNDNSDGQDENKFPSPQFQYSVAIGFTSFAGLFGTFRYISSIYIPTFLMAIIIFFLLVFSFLIFGMVFSILLEGLSLVNFFANRKDELKSYSKSFFNIGMLFAFLGLPIAIMFSCKRLIGDFLFPESSRVDSILLFIIIVISILVWRHFLDKKALQAFNFKIFLLILLFALSLTVMTFSISYDIVIEEEKYMINEERMCVITVKATGSASIDEEKPKLSIYSYSTETERTYPLVKIDKSTYYAEFQVSDLGSGFYYIEFLSRFAIRRKLLIIS